MKEYPFKNTILAGIAALGMFSASAHEAKSTGTIRKPETISVSTPTNIDARNVYNQNKQEYDQEFRKMTYESPVVIPGIIPENQHVVLKVKGLDRIKITIITDESEDQSSVEEYTDIDSLGQKYPLYKPFVSDELTKIYNRYMETKGWSVLLNELTPTLSNSFENYQPSTEELEIVTASALAHNQGEPNDGYDDILSYYRNLTNTPEKLYKFCKDKNTTPEDLAKHMQMTYYAPLIKQP